MQIGHYQLGEELGAGGMGTVYRGINTRSNIPVAIKQLKSEIATAETIERFRREGEALRELNHPNIVKMLDTFEHEGQHYLVMEFVSGGDLKGMIDDDDTLDIPQIVNMAIDLADALTRAHRLNIIHRDLKPANVLIGEDGVLRLTDFGVAHVGSQERVTDTDAIVGTIDYLPPEAFDGSFDARGDIWAFGVMLFEMLSGERPFTGNTIMETLQAITTKPIPDLEALCPSAPVALVDLVYRMLERDPQTRMSSVRYVGAQLEDILHGHEPSGRFKTDVPQIYIRPKSNLPIQTTPFVGREFELIELDKFITQPDRRLITVLAPGGMGKTRLALACAERHLSTFDDGVFFVDLTAIVDSTDIASTIATALAFQLADNDQPAREQVLDFLSHKQMLLVIDNFEHVIDSADIVTEILQSAPDVTILVTSRVRLDQSGETLFHLSGMDFPDWETPEDATEYTAVKLFLQSATRANPLWELTQDNLSYVARICRLVGGMPLGIVLAASWLSMLSVEEIAEEIANGIDFLESTNNSTPDRQQSIQVVFEYSWDTLTSDEQVIFMKMSIFRGGFTRQAVQTVTGALLRQLMSLVNKSLIRRDATSGRYSIHELARQYGYDKLEHSGQLDTTLEAHRVYFTSMVSNLTPMMKGSGQVEATAVMNADYDNILLAWNQSVNTEQWLDLRDMVLSLNIYQSLSVQLRNSSPFINLMTQLRNASNRSRGQDILMAWLLGFYPYYWNELTPDESLRLAKEGLSIAHQLDEPITIALCLNVLALAYGRVGKFEKGLSHIQESVELARSLDEPYYLIRLLKRLADYYLSVGQIDNALLVYQEAIALSKLLGEKVELSQALHNYAVSLVRAGQMKKSSAIANEALQLQRETGNIGGIGYSLMNKALKLIRETNFEAVSPVLQELEQIAHDLNDKQLISAALGCRALVAVFHEQYDIAINSSYQALGYMRQDSLVNWIARSSIYLSYMLILNHQLDKALPLLHEFVPQANQYYSANDLLEVVWAYSVHAYRQDKPIYSAELLGFVLSHPDCDPFIYRHPTILKLKDALPKKLGQEQYEKAYQRGKTKDLVTTVQELLEIEWNK